MVAPLVLDGPMNATAFVYIKQCLVPTLKRSDIVMTDSAPVHKVAGVRPARHGTPEARLPRLAARGTLAHSRFQSDIAPGARAARGVLTLGGALLLPNTLAMRRDVARLRLVRD